MTLSKPTLYSYGTVSVIPGQSISLKNISGKSIMQGSWTMSFRIRIRAKGAGGQLFTTGSNNDLVINLGDVPNDKTPYSNDIKAEFKTMQDNIVDSLCDLEIGVWHNITMTVEVLEGNSKNANVIIYTDGSPFESPSSSINPTLLTHYCGSKDNSNPILGGGVHADFTNIIFWNTILSETEIIQNSYELPMTKPSNMFDFSTLTLDSSLFTLNNAARISCIDPGVLFNNGVAIPDPADNLNPAGDSSKAFSIQAWIYSTPPISPNNAVSQMTIVSNGFATNNLNFAFRLQYGSTLKTFKLVVKLPGDQEHGLVRDKTILSPYIWYNVALTYDGKGHLSLYVDGKLTSTNTITTYPVLEPNVCIGGLESPDSASRYTNYYLGYLQSLGIWDRVLTADEIEDFQTQSIITQEQSIAYYALISTEFANNITSRRLSFKGNTALAETAIENFSSSPNRNTILTHANEDDVFNLTTIQDFEENPPNAPKYDKTTPIVSSSFSKKEVDGLKKQVKLYIKQAPKKLQPQISKQLWHSLHIGLQRSDKAKKPVPGCFTSAIEGKFRVFYYHTKDGSVETMRVDARSLSDCDAWKIEMGCAVFGLVLSLIGVKLSGKALTKAMSENTKLLGKALSEVGKDAKTASGVLAIFGLFYSSGQLGSIIAKIIVDVSWWSYASTIASIMFTIAGMFATGGWYVAWIAAQILLNIAVIAITYDNKPQDC